MKAFQILRSTLPILAFLLFPGLGRAADAAEEQSVISLKSSADSFIEAFNRLKGRPRFVTLLSPT